MTGRRKKAQKRRVVGRKPSALNQDIDFGDSLSQEQLLAMTGEAHNLAYSAGSSTQVGLAWHAIGRALEHGATRLRLRRKKERWQHARARKARVGRGTAPNPDTKAILRRAMRGT